MSAFLDTVIFPTEISEGSTGGPDWPADVITLASGFEERRTMWSAPLRVYDAKWGVRWRFSSRAESGRYCNLPMSKSLVRANIASPAYCAVSAVPSTPWATLWPQGRALCCSMPAWCKPPSRPISGYHPPGPHARGVARPAFRCGYRVPPICGCDPAI